MFIWLFTTSKKVFKPNSYRSVILWLVFVCKSWPIYFQSNVQRKQRFAELVKFLFCAWTDILSSSVCRVVENLVHELVSSYNAVDLGLYNAALTAYA